MTSPPMAIGVPGAIKAFRSGLIERGFRHHGPAGQLVRRARDRWLFVRTGMSAGQYVVYVYLRSGGFHGAPVDTTSVGIGLGSDTAALAEIADALTGWDGAAWPVHPALELTPEEW